MQRSKSEVGGNHAAVSEPGGDQLRLPEVMQWRRTARRVLLALLLAIAAAIAAGTSQGGRGLRTPMAERLGAGQKTVGLERLAPRRLWLEASPRKISWAG